MLRYIDLFAGPGIYDNGSESTPILVARECSKNEYLRNTVWMIFNDLYYIENLKTNFYSIFNEETFPHKPFFADREIGNNIRVEEFLMKSTMINGKNECPSLLFFDPFGYKGLKTRVLASFLQNWGNEIFLFINSKRMNPALSNLKANDLMNEIFPVSYNQVKAGMASKSNVLERLSYMVGCLGDEFSKVMGRKVYFTSFQFQEEDSRTTSHFILHLTKDAKGYELVKTIYNDFANVGTDFDGIHTYTFDPKIADEDNNSFFNYKADNIGHLSSDLYKEYTGRRVLAKQVFDEHQVKTNYCLQHYTQALRQLVTEGKVSSLFTDNKKHKVSVLISNDCLLDFH